MKKLIEQIIKFGIVGVIATIVDWGIYAVLVKLYEKGLLGGLPDVMSKQRWEMIATTISFSVSVIVNYIGSMKFVFERRDDMSPVREFIIFIVLSVMGLGINVLIIFALHPVEIWVGEQFAILEGVAFLIPKGIATFLVLVWNFVTRKMFLEQKQPQEEV